MTKQQEMHELEAHIDTILETAQVMQLATSHDELPWVCTVYFVELKRKLYWLSLPTRAHSKHIQANEHVAVALVGKVDKPVIGLQGRGVAHVVTDAPRIKAIMKQYVAKYSAGKEFYDNFVAGKNQHWLYEFDPSEYVLFDEQHFPSDPQKTWVRT